MKITSIKEIESFPLYDISVDERHCFKLSNGVIAHNSMDKYSPLAMGGGGGIVYASNQIFFISKSTNRAADREVEGFNFTLTSEKSRYVREKAKFPFTVNFKGGLYKWSHMFDLALLSGALDNPSMGWYQVVDLETGEVVGPKRRRKDIETDEEFFENLVANENFKEFVQSRYRIGSMNEDDEIESE